MSKVEVVEVSSPSQFTQFLEFPYHLYKGDPSFVPPLRVERRDFFNPAKNPFFRAARVSYFLALQHGEVVGRIATCINYTHNEFHGEKTGFFGFYDTIDDYAVGSVLLKVAMIWIKKEGMDRMRGPMNFSTNHEIGFLIEGFDTPPTLMMTYNKPYQGQFAERFGMKKSMDLLALKLPCNDPIPERIDNVVTRLQERSRITIRTINMRNFKKEIRNIRKVYNAAWEKNWGFVPMDEAEFDHTAANMKQIIDPDMVFIAEHAGEPVGFLIALPNINQVLQRLDGNLLPFGLIKLLWHTKVKNKVDQLRVLTLGVVPEYRKRAIDLMLYRASVIKSREKGYIWGELSWVLETNTLMVKGALDMGAKIYKRYRVVELPLFTELPERTKIDMFSTGDE
ncbi:MAG: N-acetyltransferase [Candidatus Zixiibacteriota bacterium]